MKDDTPFILECPGCHTRYEIPVAIPESGRKVRCASCTHIWIAQAGDEFRLGEPPPFEEVDVGQEIVFRKQEDIPEPEAPDPPQETTATPAAIAMPPAAQAAPPAAATDNQYGAAPEPEPEGGPEPHDRMQEEAQGDAFATAMAEAEAGSPDERMAPDETDQASQDSAFAEAVAEAAADASFEMDVDFGQPEAEAADKPPESGGEEDLVEAFYGEPGQDAAGDAPVGHPEERVVVGKPKRRSSFSVGVAAGWLGLLLAIFGVGALAASERVEMVRMMPGSAWVFETLGMPVNIRGLDFRDVAYSWENDAGQVVLEVHGDIVNVTPGDLAVPSLVLALRDENEVEVYQWEEAVMNEPLGAGNSATFAVRIPTPPKSVKSVQVRFAKAR